MNGTVYSPPVNRVGHCYGVLTRHINNLVNEGFSRRDRQVGAALAADVDTAVSVPPARTIHPVAAASQPPGRRHTVHCTMYTGTAQGNGIVGYLGH